jgi:hypothetical protein
VKKNLLYPEAAAHLITRVQNLQPDSPAQWGSMNATEMLLHANICNAEIFEDIEPIHKTTIKQFLLRILALYIAPNFKKGVKGDPKNDTKGKIDVMQFEAQKARFIELVQRFPQHKGPLTLPHIAFGNISTREWGIAAYKHMDHHLRQFGV